MAITKTLTEVKEMLPKFISNVSATSALPNFDTAEDKYLVPIVGYDLYEYIHGKYNANTLDAEETILCKKMRLVAVAYAYSDSLALGHITLTDNGARKFSPNGTKEVFKWEFNELKEALINAAVDGAEVLLNYLFEKKPALWTGNFVYTKINSLLIRTGTDFNTWYDLHQPMRTFWSIRSVIADVQNRYIREAIGKDLLKYLIDLAAPADEMLESINLLKQSLAFFTIKHVAKRYAVRISAQGFTVAAGEGDKDSPEQGRMGADGISMDLLVQECEDGGQDYLEKAKYALAELYKLEGTSADFKTALDKGPLKSYVNPSERTSGNENWKGIFKL